MANVLYNVFKRDLMNGSIDLDTDTIMVMLVTSGYTPNIDSHTKRSDITNEVQAPATRGYDPAATEDAAAKREGPMDFDLQGPFQIPLWFDYIATFVWAITGALIAARRGYDIAGIAVLALVSATGGGLLRDGIFLQSEPPLFLRTWVYMALVIAAAGAVQLAGSRIQHIPLFNARSRVIDAFGLGGFAITGLQLSLAAGLSAPGGRLRGGGQRRRRRRAARSARPPRPGNLQARPAGGAGGAGRMHHLSWAAAGPEIGGHRGRDDLGGRRLRHPHRGVALRVADPRPAGFRGTDDGSNPHPG